MNLTLVNASTRFRNCGSANFTYSCSGTPTYDNRSSSSAAPSDELTPEAGSAQPAAIRASALRTTAGSVVVHIGGRLALRNEP